MSEDKPEDPQPVATASNLSVSPGDLLPLLIVAEVTLQTAEFAKNEAGNEFNVALRKAALSIRQKLEARTIISKQSDSEFLMVYRETE